MDHHQPKDNMSTQQTFSMPAFLSSLSEVRKIKIRMIEKGDADALTKVYDQYRHELPGSSRIEGTELDGYQTMIAAKMILDQDIEKYDADPRPFHYTWAM